MDATQAHNITVAKVPDADYRRWKTRGIDARAVFVRGLDALDADEHPAAPVAADDRWFALAERFVSALGYRTPAAPAAPVEATPRPSRARLDAAYCHRQLCDHGLGTRDRVTLADVQAALNIGDKRARRIMALLVAADLATAHPRIAPLPYTWTLHPPAPGTSPPGAGI
jgi:hypothetical protein